MTTTTENRNTLVCELNDDQMERVSGGTSGMMHAVAAAAYKFMSEGSEYSAFGYALQNDLNNAKH